MLAWFTRRLQLQRTAHNIYGSIVAQARNPWFFRDLRVPDTLEGRFEILVLHVYLILDRLPADEVGEPLRQALVDKFFDDMDVIHRELGVSDLRVPKKMYRTAGVFYERLDTYARAFSDKDEQELESLVADCIYGGEGEINVVTMLADYAVRTRVMLVEQTDADPKPGQGRLSRSGGRDRAFHGGGRRMKIPEGSPISRPLIVAEIGEKGTRDRIEATRAERAAIVDLLALEALDALSFDYSIVPTGNNRFVLEGTIGARVTQACVITLDPVETSPSLPVKAVFWPEADYPNRSRSRRRCRG